MSARAASTVAEVIARMRAVEAAAARSDGVASVDVSHKVVGLRENAAQVHTRQQIEDQETADPEAEEHSKGEGWAGCFGAKCWREEVDKSLRLCRQLAELDESNTDKDLREPVGDLLEVRIRPVRSCALWGGRAPRSMRMSSRRSGAPPLSPDFVVSRKESQGVRHRETRRRRFGHWTITIARPSSSGGRTAFAGLGLFGWQQLDYESLLVLTTDGDDRVNDSCAASDSDAVSDLERLVMGEVASGDDFFCASELVEVSNGGHPGSQA
jgi:hypothetical protein